MKRIWRMAGVGLLMMTVGSHVMADDPRSEGGGQHERGPEGGRQGNEQPRPQNNQPRPQNNQPRPEINQPRPQNPHVENNQPRPQNQHFDRAEQQQHGGGQWQGRPQGAEQPRPAPQPANNLPIQGRPDTVRQTQEPRQGHYQDIPRRNDGNQHWQAGNGPGRPGGGFNNGHPNDNRWPGRPSGHGNGWGPGPQYRPGYTVDRFPDRNYRVPYRGQDYFFSGGYWYRPQGPRYVVVTPPYGIRVQYLPDYAREVWVGSALFFLAAGSYYTYENATQQYVVVQPPTEVPAPQPAPQGNGYDVVAYPANGQSPAQVQQDGYDCYRWAVQQSGFDPRTVTYAPDPAVVQTYRQAQGNCLTSRGYQVQY
ncbi:MULTISPECIES: DUF6515 family protein [Pseudomonas]|jgi:hypothetical protein|uniref:DUF6515 family protein n=1 Tax=Pseudomonas TaxID=286 RepID=UPI000D0D6CB4|nr:MULTISPECIES: DUF6515 family protein [Pseudomonas]AZF66190.1 hypothetical protein C4J83_5234 [Pseudomonas sp. LBUM920]MBT0625807.1 glycine zipper family protein [Pseudomonas fluorescens]PSL92050.1 glycine zipper family protein [Pseudomonas sp. R9.37]QJI13939.1 glycine zipper family protein [Pseudomonas sp. ADAK22]